MEIEDNDNKGGLFSNTAFSWLDNDYEILPEEDEEIDIDSIEEINAEKIILSWNKNEKETFQETREKINELIKVVKQLNNKINKEK